MIYIRTDANSTIATGHVMRCLTIAEEIVNLNEKVCFVVSDEQSTPLIKERGFKIILTDVTWDDVEVDKECELLSRYIKKRDLLLVDSYFLHSDYLKKMKRICKVATFDDMFLEKKVADIIINYNIFYRLFDYEGRYNGDSTILLLGEKYVPLRKQFKETGSLNQVRNYKNPSLLLLCGGGDSQNMIIKCLIYMIENSCANFLNIRWNVVIGKYYSKKKELEQLSKRYNNIQIYENIQNMSNLMKKCDLCITAASTVLYECCAMQLPTLFVIVAEDQKYDAQFFDANGMMIFCGDLKKEQVKTLEQIGKTIQRLAWNKTRQQSMKNLMKNRIDCEGARRIATVLIKVMEKGEI